jgi:hypoxanthine phosphoribosyltransferase
MKTLIDESRIRSKITDMAYEIDSYYKKQGWYQNTQEPVIVVGVLTGAMFFMADLVRKLSIRVELDFIRVSTYPGKATTAQEPKIITPPTQIMHGAHILLIEDILDTGNTIDAIKKCLWREWLFPEDMQTAVLLRKPGKAPLNIKVDFVGFDIPDEFVVGYGLDYNGRYREMPYVAVWSEDECRTSKGKVEQCE